jgi:hypothetical protein
MMAGRVLDLEGQGCSHIAYNRRAAAPLIACHRAGIVPHGEEAVAATVDLPAHG